MFNSALPYEYPALKPLAIRILSKVKSSSIQYSEANRLIQLLSYFVEMKNDYIPRNSILREFIGNSTFDY